jgi:hypothetical protein
MVEKESWCWRVLERFADACGVVLLSLECALRLRVAG